MATCWPPYGAPPCVPYTQVRITESQIYPVTEVCTRKKKRCCGSKKGSCQKCVVTLRTRHKKRRCRSSSFIVPSPLGLNPYNPYALAGPPVLGPPLLGPPLLGPPLLGPPLLTPSPLAPPLAAALSSPLYGIDPTPYVDSYNSPLAYDAAAAAALVNADYVPPYGHYDPTPYIDPAVYAYDNSHSGGERSARIPPPAASSQRQSSSFSGVPSSSSPLPPPPPPAPVQPILRATSTASRPTSFYTTPTSAASYPVRTSAR